MKLLKKEFVLCMHPSAFIMLALPVLNLVPNYPYAIIFFYMTLSVFFTCLSGRENHDAAYTLSLPVSRREMVLGRVGFACCLEGASLAVSGVTILVKELFLGATPNQAGMDANLALLGEGLILFGLFNLVFFPLWYKDIEKVGVPFLIAGVAVFLYVAAAVASTYAVPFVRDALDTPDPAHLGAKLIFLACGAAFFAAATALAVRMSVKRFEKEDLRL